MQWNLKTPVESFSDRKLLFLFLETWKEFCNKRTESAFPCLQRQKTNEPNCRFVLQKMTRRRLLKLSDRLFCKISPRASLNPKVISAIGARKPTVSICDMEKKRVEKTNRRRMFHLILCDSDLSSNKWQTFEEFSENTAVASWNVFAQDDKQDELNIRVWHVHRFAYFLGMCWVLYSSYSYKIWTLKNQPRV